MPTTTTYKHKLSTRNNWLFGTYQASLELSFPQHAHSLSFSVFTLLSSLLPGSVQTLQLGAKNSALIENQKGKDCPPSLHGESSRGHPYEELCRIKGALLDPLSFAVHSGDDHENSENFEVRIQTHFDSFGPGSSILHRAEVSTSHEILSVLRLQELPQAIPLRIDSMRLGLELFGQPRGWTWFSKTPVVAASLFIETDASSTSVLIESDSLHSKSAPLLPSPTLIAQLYDAVRTSFNVDIRDELQIGVA